MTYIVILSILVILWPIAATVTLGPKRVFPYIIMVFLGFFLVINSVHSIVANTTTMKILLSVLSILSLVPMVYYGWKRKCWTKDNLRKTFGWLWTLYLIMALMLILRIFINHLNSDTIAYAAISDKIKNGTFTKYGDSFWYKIPVFYHLASLAPVSVNFFSIFGEVLQVVIFSIIVNMILREGKLKSNYALAIASVLIAVASIYALSFKTSSVNWSAGAITLMGFIALRKNIKAMFLLPFAMTTFSFTAMLMTPAALMIVAWRKKWTLKEIILVITTTLVTLAFMRMNLANMPYKYFGVIWVLVGIMALGMWCPKIPNKVINNFVYKIKIQKLIDLGNKKNYNLHIIVGSICFYAFVQTFLTLMYTGVIGFPLIVTPKVIALMTTIPFAVTVLITDALINKKISIFLKWLLVIFVLMGVYAVAQLIPGVLDYMLDRVALPYAGCITLVALLRITQMDFIGSLKNKDNIFRLSTVGLLTVSSAGLITGDLVPSILWSRLSTNISQNFEFVTKRETNAVKSQLTSPNDVIYSDIAISTIDGIGNKHAFFTSANRDPFFSEMHDRTLGIPNSFYEEFIRYSRLQIQHGIWDKTSDELKKLTTNVENFEKERDALAKKDLLHWKAWRYAPLASAIDVLASDSKWWNEWDKVSVDKDPKNPNAKRINKFMFRRKEYAGIVSKHYSDKYNKKIDVKSIDGMYLVVL